MIILVFSTIECSRISCQRNDQFVVADDFSNLWHHLLPSAREPLICHHHNCLQHHSHHHNSHFSSIIIMNTIQCQHIVSNIDTSRWCLTRYLTGHLVQICWTPRSVLGGCFGPLSAKWPIPQPTPTQDMRFEAKLCNFWQRIALTSLLEVSSVPLGPTLKEHWTV